MLLFKEQIHYLDHLVSGTSILLLTDKIKALKPPTKIKGIRHFLSLTDTTENSYTTAQTLHTPQLFNMQVPTFHLDYRLPIQF